MPKIRVALVGCGNVALSSHLPSLIRLKDMVSVVAVSDTDLKRAESASKKFGIRSFYRSWEEMIVREEPDLVHICTPPDSHAQVSVGALERGCHVMVEKPMATTLKECDEMIGAASKSGRMLCVAHNQRFHPCFLRARKMIAGGELGEVLDVRITHQLRKSVYLDPEHWVHRIGGGFFLENFPHPIYLAISLLGRVDLLSAEACRLNDHLAIPHDTFRVALQGGNARCMILVSFGGGSWNYTVEAIATSGAVDVDMYNSILITRRLPTLKVVDKNLSLVSQWGQLTSQSFCTALRPSSKRWLQTHRALIKQFVDAIIGGGRTPVPPEEGRETVRICSEIAKKFVPAHAF
ncbi:MAG: Gfo/Idh/MocA family oxidoreductase [Candidatus Verstraetearchaeota archaeon]|nr:Gfo/Idh/MocA family oxidoreductase [Candidatus Verstraetearchaeota archaeon]